MLSLRNTAFALGPVEQGRWSLRTSLKTPIFPSLPGGAISARALALRFSEPGSVLRSLATGVTNTWSKMERARIVAEIRQRLRDPMIMAQSPTGLCGPLSIVMELARRSPTRYVLAAKELLEKGRLTCPTGRVIEAEDELREEPVTAGLIGQADWLVAATMRDDENIWEDVDDTANGIETITLWDEQRGWTRDVLNLPNGGSAICFSWGEIDCMKKAQNAVNSGGVAFFLIDSNLLKDGGSDDEEDMWWRLLRRQLPNLSKTPVNTITHSKDDDLLPPDHWVVYLGGLNLGEDPDDADPVSIRLWSWGGEFEVTGTVDAFTEYLYGVVTGWS